MKQALLAFAVALLLITIRISAHHAFAAEYDVKRHVTASGTVTQFKWINPHVWLFIESKDKSGRVSVWKFELGSPVGLLARCWTKTDLKVGDQVTVEGYGTKDGSNAGNATWISLPDGRKLYGGFQETPGAPPKLCNN